MKGSFPSVPADLDLELIIKNPSLLKFIRFKLVCFTLEEVVEYHSGNLKSLKSDLFKHFTTLATDNVIESIEDPSTNTRMAILPTSFWLYNSKLKSIGTNKVCNL